MTMMYLVGLRFSYHIEESVISSFSRLGMFSFEANEFLTQLMANENWAVEIIATVDTSLASMLDSLQ
jgi:hypothetical protein